MNAVAPADMGVAGAMELGLYEGTEGGGPMVVVIFEAVLGYGWW